MRPPLRDSKNQRSVLGFHLRCPLHALCFIRGMVMNCATTVGNQPAPTVEPDLAFLSLRKEVVEGTVNTRCPRAYSITAAQV